MKTIKIPYEYSTIKNTCSDNKTWYYCCKKCIYQENTNDIDKGISFLQYPLIEKEQIFKNGIKHIRLECGKCNTWIGWKEQPSENFIFPFGKYKGEKLKHIPTNYLEWLEEKDVCKGVLKVKVLEVLDKRED